MQNKREQIIKAISTGKFFTIKFIKKNGESNVYGYRELEIINNASPCDFVFKGFYDE